MFKKTSYLQSDIYIPINIRKLPKIEYIDISSIANKTEQKRVTTGRRYKKLLVFTIPILLIEIFHKTIQIAEAPKDKYKTENKTENSHKAINSETSALNITKPTIVSKA